MAPEPRKRKNRPRNPFPRGASRNALNATEDGGARRSLFVKKVVQPAENPSDVAIEAAEAALRAAQEHEKAAVAAAAAAEAEAASAAIVAARQARQTEGQRANRAERPRAKRAIASDAAPEDANSPRPGVIYIGHLPHGFYEKELRGFFSQFGTVLRVRVARSRKMARSKGYAWVQFANEAVARIAAETMNGYLLFGRLLHVDLVPVERQHERMWLAKDRPFRFIPWRYLERKRHNKSDPLLAAARRTARLLARARTASKKLAAVGVKYEAPAPIGRVPQLE
ncbi:hypothetical protein MMPV_002812 [Pyropia vietnamensis]